MRVVTLQKIARLNSILSLTLSSILDFSPEIKFVMFDTLFQCLVQKWTPRIIPVEKLHLISHISYKKLASKNNNHFFTYVDIPGFIIGVNIIDSLWTIRGLFCERSICSAQLYYKIQLGYRGE